MEALKMWAIEDERGAKITPLDTAGQTESEGLLEDILTRNPDMLEEGLELVGRQTETAGGPLDLLGVDRDGRLVVFEIKRGTLNRGAVAQIIDYVSYLGAMDLGSLYRHVAERSGNLGVQKIDDFEEWYSRRHPDTDSLKPPRMVLVGLGVDDVTERMVNYLAESAVDISLLTFHGFQQGDRTLLARHVDVDSSNVETRPTPPVNRAHSYDERVKSLRVQDLVDAATTMFSDVSRNQGVSFWKTHSKTRRQFNLDYSWLERSLKSGATLFIEIEDGGIGIGFHPMAIGLASPDEFDELDHVERSPATALLKPEEVDYEIKCRVCTTEDWTERKERLATLVRKVCEGYAAAKEKALSEDRE